MSKPPTSQRGRRPRAAPAAPPPPPSRPLLRRFVAGRAVLADAEPPASRRIAPSAGYDADLDDLDEEVVDGEAAGSGRRAWRPIATSLLCLIGLGVSVYLTVAHYAHYSLICSDSSVINCAQVTHSPQAYVFGIPVAVLGLVFFVPMLPLCSPWAWRSANRLVAPARLGALVVGVGFIFYLIYNELFVIQKICLDCSFVHLVTLLLFVIVATGWEEAVQPARLAAAAGGARRSGTRVDELLDRMIGV